MSSADDPFSLPASEAEVTRSRNDERESERQIDFDLLFFNALLRRAPDFVDVLRCQGELLSRKGDHQRALVIDRRLARLCPDDPVVAYNLACSLALLGDEAEALAALERAIAAGYDDIDHLDADADLDGLRPSAAFQSLVRPLRARSA